MIKSFKHKGLEKFFTTGSTAGIQAKHSAKVRDQLAFLDSATCIEDMDLPSFRLHELKGKLKGKYSITVSGNWRIVFEFIDGDAYIVNYEDYH
ncbi:type II toxin-antitoxin system RelE/ParE family toxin [Methylophaga frappieri]|jgi:proteic killer suppression protein|nr:type II toxin-antitoxin system RelE/ParE family toxin [Methylophaga frappieri]